MINKTIFTIALSIVMIIALPLMPISRIAIHIVIFIHEIIIDRIDIRDKSWEQFNKQGE